MIDGYFPVKLCLFPVFPRLLSGNRIACYILHMLVSRIYGGDRIENIVHTAGYLTKRRQHAEGRNRKRSQFRQYGHHIHGIIVAQTKSRQETKDKQRLYDIGRTCQGEGIQAGNLTLLSVRIVIMIHKIFLPPQNLNLLNPLKQLQRVLIHILAVDARPFSPLPAQIAENF